MINEKMQNDAWRSLPKDFKDEIKRVYNRACYSMAALRVNNILDWLFGIENLTEDEQKKEEEKERKLYEELKRNMEQIVLPEGYEVVKEGDKYLIKEKEKKQEPPRSWEEFCERYPKQKGECFIGITSVIRMYDETSQRYIDHDKNTCGSKEEAEAFLALMQLRQLRKAWVGEWEQPSNNTYIAVIAYNINNKEVVVETGKYWSNMTLSFPTRDMAEDFLNCFKDLCETAKILL